MLLSESISVIILAIAVGKSMFTPYHANNFSYQYLEKVPFSGGFTAFIRFSGQKINSSEYSQISYTVAARPDLLFR